MKEEIEKQRLDKWLWAARFFKTRVLASEAVTGGKVHLNGDRVKPGRTIKVTDRLTISKGQFEHDVIVEGLNPKRRPAKEAQLLYQETEESINAREERSKEIKAMNSQMVFTEKRPSKKGRRQIVRFKRKQNT
jgi:ribosome-associated heat shock protein Hsp15